jgi:hypothetical protein
MGTRKAGEGEGMLRAKTSAFYVKLGVIGLIIIGGAYFLGTSDSGEIDISATIQASNEMNQANGDGSVENVANIPEAFRNKPNGGLVPQGSQPAPVPEEVLPPNDEATASEEAVIGKSAD